MLWTESHRDTQNNNLSQSRTKHQRTFSQLLYIRLLYPILMCAFQTKKSKNIRQQNNIIACFYAKPHMCTDLANISGIYKKCSDGAISIYFRILNVYVFENMVLEKNIKTSDKKI